MNKTQIDCFITAANTGSLAAAAKELFLTQQAVSQNILNLEKESGCTLFIRNKKGVVLTEDGKWLYPKAEHWRECYNNTRHRIEDHYAGITTSFRIGVTEYVDILGTISGGLASFAEKNKDISLSGIQHKNRYLLEKIEQGELDVAIVNEMQIVTGGDFAYVPFAKEDLRLYISGYHPEKSPDEITPEEIKEACADLPHISSRYGMWDTSDWEEISHRVASFLGYDFKHHYEAVNSRTKALNLITVPCTVICCARFGYVPQDMDIFNVPIKTDSSLCVLWHRKNENPLIKDFTEHMQNYYK